MDCSGEFIAFAVETGVLRFGEFKTKAGRLSPYFFNAGLFSDGASLNRLTEFYARAILDSGLARRIATTHSSFTRSMNCSIGSPGRGRAPVQRSRSPESRPTTSPTSSSTRPPRIRS